MKRIVFVLLLASCASMAHQQEPTSEFTGEGMVKSKPDFISLSISVHADCQPNPKDAQTAVDNVVGKIDAFLQTLKPAEQDEHFKILIDGGYTAPYSFWANNKELCRNTFKKATTITFKVGNREDFSDTFATIQKFVLDNYQQSSNLGERDVPRSYVTVSTPNPEITRAHRLELEKDALDQAVRNAKDNFKAAIRSCEDHRWKVHSIRENGGSHYPSTAPMRSYAKAIPAAHMESDQVSSAPVRFDEIEITKSVNVLFQFEGTLCFEK